MAEIRAYKPPGELACPSCEAYIAGVTPVSGKPGGLRKGLISVCAHCSALLVLGDSNYRQMLPGELKKLDPATHQQLLMIQAQVRRKIAAAFPAHRSTA